MKILWVLVGLLVLVLGAVVWVVMRSRSDRSVSPAGTQETQPARPLPKRSAASWGKTVVVPDPAKACPAVLRIQGQSFTNEAAPRLPLSNCSVANCQCHYAPAKERRAAEERRSGMDRRTQLRFEPGKAGDRRSGKDRRHRKGYDWDQTI
jgi:hypothetical protein